MCYDMTKYPKGEDMSVILLIEDDDAVYGEIERLLTSHGYDVVNGCCGDNISGAYDLALLDIGLPGASGYDICETVRRTHDCPIVFLTALESSESELKGFASGADDYIRKPFDPGVLLARIARLLRVPEKSSVTCLGITLDVTRMEASAAGGSTVLSRSEFLLLRRLMEKRGIVTRWELTECLWDGEEYVGENTLRVEIYRLRGRLAAIGAGVSLEAVRGEGYVLKGGEK